MAANPIKIQKIIVLLTRIQELFLLLTKTRGMAIHLIRMEEDTARQMALPTAAVTMVVEENHRRSPKIGH